MMRPVTVGIIQQLFEADEVAAVATALVFAPSNVDATPKAK